MQLLIELEFEFVRERLHANDRKSKRVHRQFSLDHKQDKGGHRSTTQSLARLEQRSTESKYREAARRCRFRLGFEPDRAFTRFAGGYK